MSIRSILLATVVSFLILWVWYSPAVFGNVRMKASGMSPKKKKPSPKQMATLSLGQFITMFVMATITAIFLNYGNVSSISDAILTVILLWLGYQATRAVSTQLREGKPRHYTLINAGADLVTLIIMAIILVLI